MTVPHLGDCHELENIHRFTHSLGSQTALAPRLVIPGGPLPQAVLQGRQIIAFHAWACGSQHRMREWPDEYWACLAKELDGGGRFFILTCSPADKNRCEALCRLIVSQGTPAEILVGRDGLGEIARVLTHTEMLVSVNTGIMHLGAILGVPTVSINGPTAAHRWGPAGPRVANVCPSDGTGGFLDLGFEFRGHCKDTMRKIPVADVMRAIHSLYGMPYEREVAANRDAEPAAASSHALKADAYPDRVLPLQIRQRA